MRKYIIGFLAGCAFMTMATAFAGEVQSIIGKTVENTYPVTVNGTALSTQAAVIDGSAYLPVRAVSDAVGLSVGFSETTGIALTEKEATTTVADTSQSTSTSQTTTQAVPTAMTYKGLKAYIVNGITYYNAHDYSVGIKNSKVFSYSNGILTVNKKDGTSIALNKDNVSEIQIIDGETYINIQYYPE